MYDANGDVVTSVDEATIEDAVAAASGKYYTQIEGTGQTAGTDNGVIGGTALDNIIQLSGTTVEYKGTDKLYKADGTEISDAELGDYFQALGGTVLAWASDGSRDS